MTRHARPQQRDAMPRLRPTPVLALSLVVAGCAGFGDTDRAPAPPVTPASQPGYADPAWAGTAAQPGAAATPSTAAPTADAPAFPSSSLAATPPSVPASPASPAIGGPALQDRGVSDAAQQARQYGSLVEQRTGALVMRFIDDGLARMEAGDLEGAYEAFANAYELDPTNPGARDLFERTGALLGDRAQALSAIAQGTRERSVVRRMQTRLLAESKVAEGDRALAADRAQEAVTAYEDALTIVRTSPEIADGALATGDVEAKLARARDAADALSGRREEQALQRALARQQELDAEEATRRDRRIVSLLESANAAFLADDYATAESLLDDVLLLDPTNTEAEDLKDLSTKARHEAAQRGLRLKYRNAWRNTFDSLRLMQKPPNELMTFPPAPEWAAINERATQAYQSRVASPTLGDGTIRERLASVRIPTSFVEEPLDQVLDHLGQVTGVNFLMSADVRDEMDAFTYSLENRVAQPVTRILDILLHDLSIPELDYTIRDGIVHVILKDEARDDYVLRVYDMRDLTFTPSDYGAQDFNLLPSGTDPASFTEGVEEDDPVPFVSTDTIVSLIQENIAPDTWTDDPERTIQDVQGKLVVRQTPEVHTLIEDLLANLRLNQHTMIHIETRFIEVEDSFLEDIGVDLRGLDPSLTGGSPLEDFGQSGAGGFGSGGNPAGIGTGNDPGFFYTSDDGDLKGRIENIFDSGLGETGTLNNSGGVTFQALFIDDTNVNVLLRAVSKYQTQNLVDAPSLTLRSGQRGNVQVITTRTYVRDYEPEIAQAAVIAQPELANVKDGIVLDVRPVASADRRFVTMEIRPMLAELIPDELGRDIRQEQISLATAASDTVIVELPELEIQRLRTTATIPDGGTLMLAGLKRTADRDLETGTPFLSDIPFLNFFFERQGQYKSARKLIILIKARIIAPGEREPRLPLDY